MKVSVDGLRRNLAQAYCRLVEGFGEIDRDASEMMMKDALDEMRSMIGALMCMYSDDPDDLMSDMTDEADKLPWAETTLEATP